MLPGVLPNPIDLPFDLIFQILIYNTKAGIPLIRY